MARITEINVNCCYALLELNFERFYLLCLVDEISAQIISSDIFRRRIWITLFNEFFFVWTYTRTKKNPFTAEVAKDCRAQTFIKFNTPFHLQLCKRAAAASHRMEHKPREHVCRLVRLSSRFSFFGLVKALSPRDTVATVSYSADEWFVSYQLHFYTSNFFCCAFRSIYLTQWTLLIPLQKQLNTLMIIIATLTALSPTTFIKRMKSNTLPCAIYYQVLHSTYSWFFFLLYVTHIGQIK